MYDFKLSRINKNILYKEAIFVLMFNSIDLKLFRNKNTEYEKYLFYKKNFESLKYFFYSAEMLCVYDGEFIEQLYNKFREVYYNSFRINKQIIRFSILDFKKGIKIFINKIENPGAGNLKFRLKNKIKIDYLFDKTNKDLADYDLDWNPIVDEIDYHFRHFSLTNKIYIGESIQKKSKNIDDQYTGNSFTGYILKKDLEKIHLIACNLFEYRLIKRKKDIEYFIKLFSSNKISEDCKVVWLKSPRLLIYFLIILNDRGILKNKDFKYYLINHDLFVDRNNHRYTPNTIYKSYNVANKYYCHKALRLRGSEIIDNKIFAKESSTI